MTKYEKARILGTRALQIRSVSKHTPTYPSTQSSRRVIERKKKRSGWKEKK